MMRQVSRDPVHNFGQGEGQNIHSVGRVMLCPEGLQIVFLHVAFRNAFGELR